MFPKSLEGKDHAMSVSAALNDFFKPWGDWFPDRHLWGKTFTVPAVNIKENGNEYLVSIGIPGVKKEDIRVDVHDRTVSVSAASEHKEEERKDEYTLKQYNYSSFSRSFSLPEGAQADKIDAVYENGELKLSIPKAVPQSRKETVNINVK